MVAKQPVPLPPGQPVPNARRMLAAAYRHCRQKRFPVWDMEYASAINYAVARAVQKWRPEACDPIWLACKYAVEECIKARQTLRRWLRQDTAMSRTEAEIEQPKTPIPLSDFEILQFVAAHGRRRAAKLLAMAPDDLRDILEDIEERVKQLLR